MTNKALIIIDLQNYYINEDTKHIPSKIKEFIKSNNFEHILFTKYVNNENSGMSKIFNWKKMFSSPDIDIINEFSEFLSDKNVFQKSTYSAFKSEEFKQYLETNNISELIICGLDTDACVLATAYEGFDLGYKINVIDELTASHCGNNIRESGLDIINKNLQIKRA